MKASMKEVISFLKECLEERSGMTDKGLAGCCLMSNRSFQLTEECEKDPLLGLAEFRRSWRKLSKSSSGYKKLGDSDVLLSVAGMPESERVMDYIRHSKGRNVGHVFSRDEIQPEENIPFSDRFAFILFSIPIIFRCFFSSHQRCNRALLMRETVISYLLLDRVRKNKIRFLYNFVPYEIDSNFQSLLMRENQVHVTFIPSSGPLATWNSVMICEEVIFSTPYHYEEWERYRDTMRFSSVVRWGPERAYSYIDKYMVNRPETKKKTLGFYSHGSWLRSALGHTQTEMDLAGAESACIDFIKQFLANHPEWSLIIFTHPRERNKAYIEQTRAYFQSSFEGVRWAFADMARPSSHLFDEVEIGLSTFSTIIYERLYCGYKTLICTRGIEGFPMEGSSLNQLTFADSEEMERRIEDSGALSEKEFFYAHHLSGYLCEQLEWRAE